MAEKVVVELEVKSDKGVKDVKKLIKKYLTLIRR